MNWHKITHNSMENRGSTPIFNKLRVHLMEYYVNLKEICALV